MFHQTIDQVIGDTAKSKVEQLNGSLQKSDEDGSISVSEIPGF